MLRISPVLTQGETRGHASQREYHEKAKDANFLWFSSRNSFTCARQGIRAIRVKVCDRLCKALRPV
jgi:hypothetical protein